MQRCCHNTCCAGGRRGSADDDILWEPRGESASNFQQRASTNGKSVFDEFNAAIWGGTRGKEQKLSVWQASWWVRTVVTPSMKPQHV